MSSRISPFTSTVGTKILIGLTGLALVFYLLTHIAGNALIFLGPAVFNQYAETLGGNPLIPLIEVGLALIFLIHVYKTIRMYLANRRARPTQYTAKRSAGGPSRKSLASTTMILSGTWLLVFIVLHVWAFRFDADYETADGIRDLYRVEMEIFSNPLTVLFYVLSMAVVGSHLWHGGSSALQSLGADNPKWTPRLRAAGKVFAIVVAGGFMVIAVWAYLTGGRS